MLHLAHGTSPTSQRDPRGQTGKQCRPDAAAHLVTATEWRSREKDQLQGRRYCSRAPDGLSPVVATRGVPTPPSPPPQSPIPCQGNLDIQFSTGCAPWASPGLVMDAREQSSQEFRLGPVSFPPVALVRSQCRRQVGAGQGPRPALVASPAS